MNNLDCDSSLYKNTLSGLRTTYAVITSAGTVIDHAALFPVWITGTNSNLIGNKLIEIIPEFIGYEEEFQLIHQGRQSELRLESINRVSKDGSISYYTFTVIADNLSDERRLIVLVTNATEQGKYIQALTQSRNELTLTRQRLATLSSKLDYVVRHYLSPQVTDALLKGDMNLELGGYLRDITVLFADARNFTRLSETLSPADVVQVLNSRLDIIADAITIYDGTITQFQGDNVIALFNESDHQPHHALNAVNAGIAIQQALATYHQLPTTSTCLEFGVGINTGSALIGNIGAKHRFSYTATGDAVNLAARISSAVPANEIWISKDTFQQLATPVAVEPIAPMTFKGKSNAVELYRVSWR